MVCCVRYFIFPFVLLLGFVSSGHAMPQKQWVHVFDDASVYVNNVAIAPTHKKAFALVSRGSNIEIAVFGLEDGAALETLTPEIPRSRTGTYLRSLAVSDRYLVVHGEDGQRGADRVHFMFVYDVETLALLHAMPIPKEFKDYVPAAVVDGLSIAGDHLIVNAQARQYTIDSSPMLFHYDLASGEFVKGLDQLQIDPNAEKGWFGSRPKTPPGFFAAYVLSGDMLFVNSTDGEKSSDRIFVYDLETGEKSETELSYNGDAARYKLFEIADDHIHLVVDNGPITRANVVSSTAIEKVDRVSGAVLSTYADPFALSDKNISLGEVIVGDITGDKPFLGSWFPERIAMSEKYLVASAPNAPSGTIDGVGAIIVYDADNAQLASIIGPATKRADGYFGRDFAHEGAYILATSLTNLAGEPDPVFALELYKLD